MTDTTKLADVLANARAELGASGHYSEPVASILDAADNLVAALRAAPAAEIPGKPVAWMYPGRYGSHVSFVRPADYTDEDGNLVTPTPLYAAINGPAACSVLGIPPSQEGVGSAGSGAAPIEGLADAIAWTERYWNMTNFEAPLQTVIAAARAYQEAAAELARVKGERDAAIERLVWSAICWDDTAIVFRNCDRFDDANECDENAAQCRALAASK